MIIQKRLLYGKGWHLSLEGYRVEIVAVHRGEEILKDDATVGELQDGDWLEITPVVKDDGKERLSFVTYDALPSHLSWQD